MNAQQLIELLEGVDPETEIRFATEPTQWIVEGLGTADEYVSDENEQGTAEEYENDDHWRNGDYEIVATAHKGGFTIPHFAVPVVWLAGSQVDGVLPETLYHSIPLPPEDDS